jgi:hypothetical protein
MQPEDYQEIKTQYEASRGDSTLLFETILAVAQRTSLEEALASLEQCVIEKRRAWLERLAASLPNSGDVLADAYALFYGSYLGLHLPEDGQLVEAGEERITVRWTNACPTLEACRKLGMDTRQVCRLAYDRPVQLMLQAFDPRLRFKRNYEALRPNTPYCEETICLEPIEN